MPTELPLWLERLLGYARVDFAPRHRQPSAVAVVAATAVSIAGSLAADALLVMLGKKLFPATEHYGHFRFSDYSKLTVIGVLIACIAWPIVTRITSSPRWLFFRQAIAVTLVLLLPDLYIWYQGQPIRAVAVLMVMHLAIALVAYNSLVHIAKVGEPVAGRRHKAPSGSAQNYRGPWDADDRHVRPASRSRYGSPGPWDEDERDMGTASSGRRRDNADPWT